MTKYSTSSTELADALQSLVDDLRAAPVDDLPEMAVTVYIQAISAYGTVEARTRAVDLIGWAVAGATGKPEKGGAYRTPYETGIRPGLDVRVFTAGLADGGAPR